MVVRDDVTVGVVDEAGALGLRLLRARAAEGERRVVAGAPGGRDRDLDDAVAGAPVHAVDRHRLGRGGGGARGHALLDHRCRLRAVGAERGIAARSGSSTRDESGGCDQVGRSLMEHSGFLSSRFELRCRRIRPAARKSPMSDG